MTKADADHKSILLHNHAIYKQLTQLYPNEPKYIQRHIEILLQLEHYDEADALLKQLQTLLQRSDAQEDLQEAENIRLHLKQEMQASSYYSAPFMHLASKTWLNKLFLSRKNIKINEGEYLIHHGEEETQMYIVLQGALVVWSYDDQGKKHFEHTLHAGEIIGELAFLDGTRRNADVIACQDSTLLIIPNKAVFKLFLDDPKIEASLREEANTRKVQVAMKQSPALANLPNHLQRILAKEGSFSQRKILERLYASHTDIQSIDLICSGHIQFVGELHDGSSLKLNALKKGSLLGCSALVPGMDSQHIADVVSMSDLKIIQFPLEAFRKVIELNPRFYQSILKQSEDERKNMMQTISVDSTLK